MSKLLENLLKNKQSQNLSEIDMTKSGSAMMRYLGKRYPHDAEDNTPIEPEPSIWQQMQDNTTIYLQRQYELESTKFLLYFINELIELSDKMYHHPVITISHTNVTIKLYTEDINDVTDRDVEMSKRIDEIVEDINIIKFRGL